MAGSPRSRPASARSSSSSAHLVEQVFPDPDEVVHERDVNMRLALWHPDVATIRRALADLGFVRRDGMTYRRAVPPRAGGS
jgi:hypothetical protein